MIFCKADANTNRNIQSLLDKYELASGQKINKEKTEMAFSKNVSEDSQRELLCFRVLTLFSSMIST